VNKRDDDALKRAKTSQTGQKNLKSLHNIINDTDKALNLSLGTRKGEKMTTTEPLDALREAIREMISKVLPSPEVDIDEVKEEVWADLSRIYYKYEDEAQKKAFRDIMKEISEKIQDDKWENVYKKIYREELKERNGF
jgi:hypothetical protein